MAATYMYWSYFEMKACYEHRNCNSHILRMGRVQRHIMENAEPHIDKNALLYGGYKQFELTDEQKKEYDELIKWYMDCPSFSRYAPSITGHRVLDYEKLLSIGVNGVIAEIDELQGKIDFSKEDDCERDYLYTACKDALLGLLAYSGRVSESYRKAAEEEEDCEISARLSHLAEIFSHIPANPARNFYEAMQSMWILQYVSGALLHDITLTGRPSDYLYPYYKADKEKGILDDEFAQLLINDLYYRHNELYDAWPAALMIGGVNRKNEPVWNELSYLFIKAIEQTKLVNPAVAVAYNDAMPKDLMRLCVEMLAKGYTRPSFFNDKLIIEGLMAAGVSEEDARYYIHSTCVEITPIATSHILVASPYVNINKAVEMALNNGEKIWGDDPCILHPAKISTDELDTFEKFFDAICESMSLLIQSAAIEKIRHTEIGKHAQSSPLSSCFIRDCLGRGKDCGGGGARYNYVYPCFPGFINLIDSVAAVKKVVYEDKTYTLPELRKLLSSDFEGEERARQFLLNRCPKFGNDIEEIDEIGVKLYEHIRSELAKYQVPLPNGTFHPSFFAWIMHGRLGKITAASPDGRRQGSAMSESLGAAQGRDKSGPLAVIRSISKFDQKYGIGGIATNFRFSKSLMNTDAGITAVTELIHTFMKENNFECQFNVVDQNVLLDAKEHPENHAGLLVRVAGYSDYFVNLDPIIQDEIISRTEHEEI